MKGNVILALKTLTVLTLVIGMTALLPGVSAATETCNALDDDGDGLCYGGSNNGNICTSSANCPGGGCIKVDEGFVYQGKPKGEACDGIGECGTGIVYCVNTTLAGCSTNPAGPDYDGTNETCDGKDNDCDDSYDEDFTYLGIARGEACDGIGECGTGIVYCVNTTLAGCSTNMGGPDYDGSPETCDAKDNDCDGSYDEDFTYLGIARGEACDGIGECGTGTVYCIDQATAGCSTNMGGPDYDGTSEICDYKDNDCDGTTDENFNYLNILVGEFCDGIGECGTGTVYCINTSLAGCSTNMGGPDYDGHPETCDEKDNDCDATIDEDFKYLGISTGEICNGIGECGLGNVYCINTTTAGCTTNPGGPDYDGHPETCDAKDNDCDSETDENPASLCNIFNIPFISQCNYTPDSKPFTFDFFAGFTSTCSAGSCTRYENESVWENDITHTCNVAEGSQCETSNDCGAFGENYYCNSLECKCEIIGDTNYDGVIDIFDLALVGMKFGTTAEDPEWDANADVYNRKTGTGLGEVDIFDISTVSIKMDAGD